MHSPVYVCEREGAWVCSVQVSCQCCLSGAVFSLRQVMSSVTSTSAGHPMREMQRGLETAAGVKQQRVRGSPRVLEREKWDVLIMPPARRSTWLQHLWVTPCLRCRPLCCVCCRKIRWESRSGVEAMNQDTVEDTGGGGGTETEWGCWKEG